MDFHEKFFIEIKRKLPWIQQPNFYSDYEWQSRKLSNTAEVFYSRRYITVLFESTIRFWKFADKLSSPLVLLAAIFAQSFLPNLKDMFPCGENEYCSDSSLYTVKMAESFQRCEESICLDRELSGQNLFIHRVRTQDCWFQMKYHSLNGLGCAREASTSHLGKKFGMVSGICLQLVIKLITREDALAKRARLFLELILIGPGIRWQSGIKTCKERHRAVLKNTS